MSVWVWLSSADELVDVFASEGGAMRAWTGAGRIVERSVKP